MTVLDLFTAIGIFVTIIIIMSAIPIALIIWSLWQNDRADKNPRD